MMLGWISSCLGQSLPAGCGSCWEAPALPATRNPALLTRLGQDREQMGLLLLCGKNVEFQQAQGLQPRTRSRSY